MIDIFISHIRIHIERFDQYRICYSTILLASVSGKPLDLKTRHTNLLRNISIQYIPVEMFTLTFTVYPKQNNEI